MRAGKWYKIKVKVKAHGLFSGKFWCNPVTVEVVND